MSQERVADELRRLTETQQPAPSGAPHQSPEGGATAPVSEEPQLQLLLKTGKEPQLRNPGSYAPQRSGRYRGRLRSPDPYLFNSTIWIRHDSEASPRAHEDPMDQMRDRVYAMEHNLETLRTRLTQVADLRDAQGIREDHRAIVAQLNEVEECASAHTLREFMSKVLKLESMLSGENGGAIGEAIRACNRRIDNHRDVMDDFYARISIQDWYHDVSDQEGGEEVENQPGMENRPSGTRRLGGHAPQRRIQRPWQRTMPRPPPPPVNDATSVRDTERTATFPPEMMQQAMQRLFVAYNQCVARVAQTDERLEQFQSNIRRDALDMSLTFNDQVKTHNINSKLSNI